MKPILTTLLGFSLAAGSHAATLASFQFNSDLTSGDASTSWNTTDLSSGGGVPTGTFDLALGSPTAPSLEFTMGDVNDGSFKDDDYYTFTITPDSGFQIDFTSLTFDFQKESGGAAVDWEVYSSVDSFTTAVGSGSVGATGSWVTGLSTNLGGLGTQTGATDFRVYFFTTGTFGPNELLLDNLVVEGTVSAIPEPTAAILGGLGFLLLGRRRR